MQNVLKISLLPLIAAVIFGLAGIVYAEDGTAETSASAEVTMTVQATTTRPRPRPMPLQVMQEKKAQLREGVRGAVQDMRGDLKEEHLETRVEMRNATSGAERRDIMKGSVEDRKEIRGDARAEIKGNIKERLRALVKTHVGAAMRRMNTALNQFDNIIERVDSRIEKLKGRGIDTASVETSLSTSVGLVATAKADVQALSTLVESVNESSDAASVKEQLRAAIDKATASVKAAHRALLDTAKALSALGRASTQADTGTSAETN